MIDRPIWLIYLSYIPTRDVEPNGYSDLSSILSRPRFFLCSEDCSSLRLDIEPKSSCRELCLQLPVMNIWKQDKLNSGKPCAHKYSAIAPPQLQYYSQTRLSRSPDAKNQPIITIPKIGSTGTPELPDRLLSRDQLVCIAKGRERARERRACSQWSDMKQLSQKRSISS